jgi:hypothetical protein
MYKHMTDCHWGQTSNIKQAISDTKLITEQGQVGHISAPSLLNDHFTDTARLLARNNVGWQQWSEREQLFCNWVDANCILIGYL